MSTPNTLVLEENARALEDWRRAQKALEDFEAQHPDLIRHHRHLVEQVVSTLGAIEKLARSQVITLGPVIHKQTSYRVDPDKVIKVLGEQRFLQIGGTMKTTPVLDISALRSAEKKGEVTSEEVKACVNPAHSFTVKGKVDP